LLVFAGLAFAALVSADELVSFYSLGGGDVFVGFMCQRAECAFRWPQFAADCARSFIGGKKSALVGRNHICAEWFGQRNQSSGVVRLIAGEATRVERVGRGDFAG
jgi:hypothetical protein